MGEYSKEKKQEYEEKGNRIENLEGMEGFRLIFWDSDVSQIDIDKYKYYIVERILEYGNKKHVHWMLSRYSLDEIKEVLKASRCISNKSSQFWNEILKIDIPNTCHEVIKERIKQ